MSIVDQQRDLEAFSDQALIRESQQPSGQYPLFLVAAEIQRRADLRNRFQMAQQRGQAVAPSVVEQRAAMLQQPMGPDPMMQGLGAAPLQMPQQMPPQMGGGIMQTFQTGGLVRGPGATNLPDRLPERDPAQYRSVWHQIRADLADDLAYLTQDVPANFSRMADEARARQRSRIMFQPVWDEPMATDPVRGAMAGQPISPAMFLHLPQPGTVQQAQSMTAEPEQDPQVMAARARMRALLDSVDPALITGALDDLSANQQAIAGLADMATEREGDITQAQSARNEAVMAELARLEEASAIEQALSSAMRSPAELAAERRRRAMAGIGAAIAGAREVGDVGEAMGLINQGLEQMAQNQRAEQNQLSLAAATAKDRRQLQRRNLMIQQYGQEAQDAVSALNRAQSTALMGIQGRTSTANAAANLLDAANRYVAATSAIYGRGGETANEDLEMIKALTGFYADMQDAPGEENEELMALIRDTISTLTRRATEVMGQDYMAQYIEAVRRVSPELAEEAMSGRQ